MQSVNQSSGSEFRAASKRVRSTFNFFQWASS